jgi:Double-GTPase 1
VSTVPRALALLGGPESGKTTYLGALVDALECQSLPGVAITELPADTNAWYQLTDPLLDGRYPQRTKAERHTLDVGLAISPVPAGSTGLSLVTESTQVSLRMGDYDGEEVERLFRDRTRGWSEEWQARARSDGLLLFLRPPAIHHLPRVPAPELPEAERWQWLANQMVHASDPVPAPAPREPGPETYFGPGLADHEVKAPPPARLDDPVLIPTVLAVIELLQFIRHVQGLAPGERPPQGSARIALLVSAWDAVLPDWQQRGAATYLGETLPLLEDFLWSNYHESDVFRFGLSSTGGDLNQPGYSERYQEERAGFVTWTDATGRVARSRNLAIPITWALFGDRALVPESA